MPALAGFPSSDRQKLGVTCCPPHFLTQWGPEGEGTPRWLGWHRLGLMQVGVVKGAAGEKRVVMEEMVGNGLSRSEEEQEGAVHVGCVGAGAGTW